MKTFENVLEDRFACQIFFGYNLDMKRFLVIAFLISSCSVCYANELSKQATAFYSDNNRIRTMDLILQINEKERSAQDWLLLGNVLADNGKAEDAVYMYQKAIAKDNKGI